MLRGEGGMCMGVGLLPTSPSQDHSTNVITLQAQLVDGVDKHVTHEHLWGASGLFICTCACIVCGCMVQCVVHPVHSTPLVCSG